jgi:hypothetical protein
MHMSTSTTTLCAVVCFVAPVLASGEPVVVYPRLHQAVELPPLLSAALSAAGVEPFTFTKIDLDLLTLATVSWSAVPFHRISVRMMNGVGELYDQQTGERFTPRGNNFIRLASQSNLSGGTVVYHSTFNPGDYGSADMESNLSLMQASGYNTVRVFLDPLAIGNATGGLSSSYLDNVADFLGRAKAHNLYVIFTMDFVPPTSEYNTLLYSSCCASFSGANLNYLTSGGVQADQKFWQAFITGLQSRIVPFDAILAYELRNELYFDGSLPPLSLASGVVQTANGKSYDMASPADKQQMMDDNLVFWINSLRTTILLADPTALVWVGFFEPQQPNPVRTGDSRLINTRPALVSSQADVIDLHAYLDTGLSLQQLVQNFGIPTPSVKPIIMGEFGAAQSSIDSALTAAKLFQSWESQSCQYGFGGWLLWTWDTVVQPGQNFWFAEAAGGVIDQALRPLGRPDPCIVANSFSPDLAMGSKATASASLAGSSPELAIDGLLSTVWNSGAFAPQWIEIDLAAPSTIGGLKLVVGQSPSGPTVHDVYVQSKGSPQPQLVTEFSGATHDQQVLTWTPTQPLADVTSVRVVTVTSPSWVAWREIEVLAAYTNNYYFPHLAFGGGFETTLTYVNYSPQSVSCQTTFYSDAGAALQVPFSAGATSTRSDVLAPGASIHVQTHGGANPLVAGWGQAQCTGPAKASLLYRLYNASVAQGEAGVNASTTPTTEFVTFAQTATGIAYANPSVTAANVTITAFDANGVLRGNTTFVLPPNAHGAANIGPLLHVNNFTGSVQITSTAPIVSLSLNAEAFPVFSSLPPGDLPPGTPLATGR